MSLTSISDKAPPLPPIQPVRQTAPVARNDGDNDNDATEKAAEKASEAKSSQAAPPTNPAKGRNLDISV